MVARGDLTTPITIPTKVPAPQRQPEDIKYGSPEDVATKDTTIELRVCSEFLEYSSHVDYFNSGGKLQAMQDFNGEPMIFAIGENKASQSWKLAKLNFLLHQPGTARGWSMTSLSPSADPVVAFDVLKIDQPLDDRKPGLLVATATADKDGLATVYHAYLTPSDGAGGGLPATDMKGLEWTKIPDHDGKKAVSTLSVGVNTKRMPNQSPYLITVGTKMQDNTAATFYLIDLTPGLSKPWIPFALDTHEDFLKDIQPASIGTPVADGEATDREDGLFVLTDRLDRTDCMFYALDPTTLAKTNSKSTLRSDLGRPVSMFSSRNPWGFTDLFLACERGVGFISHNGILDVPIAVKGLPPVEFRQVVASEGIDPTNEAQTVFTAFALSRDNELYYFQGTRQYTWTDGLVTFSCSGLPIRADVARISCQFNANMNSSELIYVGTGSNEVGHLLRDPTTKCWTENKIQFASKTATKQYKAFMTTISVSCSDGRSVGQGFPLSLIAESTIVLVNDRSYALSMQSTTVRTDSRGQVVIVASAHGTLMAPSYACTVSHQNISDTAMVNGGQRILERLSAIKTDDAISGAKTTTGTPVFSGDEIKAKEKDFTESAQFLKEFPAMLSSVSQPLAEKDTGSDTDQAVTDKEVVLNSAGTSSTSTAGSVARREAGGFLQDLSDFAGDVIDWVRNVAKKVFKVVFKVILGGLKIVLTIAGKIFSFVVKVVGPLVRAVHTFLKEKLGIDFGKFFQWLGLTWENKKTKENQAVLRGVLVKFLKLPGEVLKANTTGLETVFDNLEQDLQPWIGDKTQPKVGDVQDPNAALKKSPLAWLFDNPIINLIMKLNPFSVISDALSEAVSEVFGDNLSFPSWSAFTAKVKKIIGDTLDKGGAILSGLLEKLWNRLKEVANDPSRLLQILKGAFQDIAHALFDAIRATITGLWAILSDIMDALVEFLDGKWQIPLVTTFFGWLADQDFTLMNVFTFVVCRIFGLIVGEDNVTKYLDINDLADSLTTTAKTTNIFGSYATPRGATQAQPSLPTMSLQVPMGMTASAFAPSQSRVSRRVSSTANAKTATQTSTATATKTEHESPASGPGGGHSELSKDATDHIHQYERDSKTISAVVGFFRLCTICLESFHLGTEAIAGSSAAKGAPHHSGALASLTAITAGATFVGSTAQILLWVFARNHSEEVSRVLDEHQGVKIAGFAITFLTTGVGAVAAYHVATPGGGDHHANVRALNLTTAMTLSIGSFAETIMVHMIPGWNHSSKAGKAGEVLELVATGLGTAAALAAYKGSPTTAAYCCVGDGIFTMLSVATLVVDIQIL